MLLQNVIFRAALMLCSLLLSFLMERDCIFFRTLFESLQSVVELVFDTVDFTMHASFTAALNRIFGMMVMRQ